MTIYENVDVFQAPATIRDITYAGAKQIVQVESFKQPITIHASHERLQDAYPEKEVTITWKKEDHKILR